MFQDGTTEKKRSTGGGIAQLTEKQFARSRSSDNDRIGQRLLDLSGEEQRDCAIVVLVIRVMMDEFVYAWTDREYRGPLKHRGQEQSDKGCSGRNARDLAMARLLSFLISVHGSAASAAS